MSIKISDLIKNKIKEYVIFTPKTQKEFDTAFELFKLNYNESNNVYGYFKDWDLSHIEYYIYTDLFYDKRY